MVLPGGGGDLLETPWGLRCHTAGYWWAEELSISSHPSPLFTLGPHPNPASQALSTHTRVSVRVTAQVSKADDPWVIFDQCSVVT